MILEIPGKQIEIAEQDEPEKLTWHEAMELYGEDVNPFGWRLPDRYELLYMFEHRNEIGGFTSDYYWSSSEYSSGYAWEQGFDNGGQDYSTKDHYYYVRAVRDVRAVKQKIQSLEQSNSDREKCQHVIGLICGTLGIAVTESNEFNLHRIYHDVVEIKTVLRELNQHFA